VEALALRGSHRGGNPHPQGFSQGVETLKINGRCLPARHALM